MKINEGLSNLTQKRREHIKSCLDNRDNSHEIIARLYSDPSHFIYELLQNADDAKASKVIFNLTSDYLEITHNGEKLFNFDDVDSITTVGSSTKDINSIGTFGAGFKSVFAITKTPFIYSGNYHFKIIDFIVPEEIKPRNIKEQNTVIVLPFNHPDILPIVAYNQIVERLKKLEYESLLFLRNIKEIKWNTESNQGHYLSKIKGDKVSIICQIDEYNEKKDYLIFKTIIKIENVDLNIVIAYLLDDNTIVPEDDAKLFVFFPTNERTGLKFLVHAPYKTTPSRETIPFDDSQNKIITNELAILITESIKTVKEKNLLSLDFLTLLPINSKNIHPLYRLAFEKVKNTLINNRLIPSSNNKYINAKDSLLAREKELTVLLNTTDCFKLFGRKNWLSTEITPYKTKELRDYFIEILKIPEIPIEKFCNELNIEFLNTKNDKWIIKFYSHIIKNKSLYSTLKKRPIIRLEDNSHICPENNAGKLQVYIPPKEKSNFKTVKRAITYNEDALEFLKSLGLKEPDTIAEIEEFIIPKYKSNSIETTEYIEEFEKVLKIWSESDNYRKPKVIDLLKKCNFIRCKNQNSVICYQKADDVYFPTDKLLTWYKGNPNYNIYFIDLNIQITVDIRNFLQSLGVIYEIKLYGNELHTIEYRENYARGVNGFNPYFDIDGLSFAINNISFEKSVFLWSILLKHTNRLKGYIEIKRNKKHSYEKESEEKTSRAINTLNNKSWLYDKNKQLIERPIELITLDELNDEYLKEDNNIEKLVKILGFKPDEIKQLEEKTGQKVILASQEEFNEWQLFKESKKLNKEKNDSKWIPETHPDDVIITVNTVEFKKSIQEDLSGQQTKESIEDCNLNDIFAEKTESHRNSTTVSNSKAIGDCGELIAKKYLEKKHPESENKIVWLNKNGCIGIGYDFVIKDNEDNDIFYYEVKSKTDELLKVFQISGTQWSWAKKLHQDKKGDMYIILLVSNVGKKETTIMEIINPIARFDANELDIDSVNIQLG